MLQATTFTSPNQSVEKRSLIKENLCVIYRQGSTLTGASLRQFTLRPQPQAINFGQVKLNFILPFHGTIILAILPQICKNLYLLH